MKKILEWHVRGLIIIVMIVGFMTTWVNIAQAQLAITATNATNVVSDSILLIPTFTVDAAGVVSPSTPLSPTITIDAARVVSYSIPLSPTIAIVDNGVNLGLNLRKGPSQSDPPKGAIWQNEQVTIHGTNNEECQWVYVTKDKGAYSGWVYSGYLRNSKKKLISTECPPIIRPKITPTVPTTSIVGQNESSNENDDSFLERYKMLAIGIATLFIAALLYWIAYTKGLFSRLRETSSASISANSTIPKIGTPYLEGMQTSAQPIYCPLNHKTISIGRDKENTLVIDSRLAQWDTVSSHHARIEQDGDSFIITDLDSKNGVFVDGRRTQENILYDGMQVRLGKVAFVFRVNGK